MNSARDVQPIWVAEVLSRIRHRKASAASLELNSAGPTPLSQPTSAIGGSGCAAQATAMGGVDAAQPLVARVRPRL